MRKDISIIHLNLYALIKHDAGENNNEIRIDRIKHFIRERIRFPKIYHFKIIRELERYKLIKRINRDYFLILPIKRNGNPIMDCRGNPLWTFFGYF